MWGVSLGYAYGVGATDVAGRVALFLCRVAERGT